MSDDTLDPVEAGNRLIKAFNAQHRTYGNTAACGGGIGGAAMTAHCAWTCGEPVHQAVEDELREALRAWERVEYEAKDQADRLRVYQDREAKLRALYGAIHKAADEAAAEGEREGYGTAFAQGMYRAAAMLNAVAVLDAPTETGDKS